MSFYDQASRYAVKLDPPGFLSWLLVGLDPDLRFSRWLDSQTIPIPGDPDRRCDTVAELVHSSGTGPPWALVLELQTRPDPEILDRVLEYLARFRREIRHGPHGRDKYLLGAAVINLTGGVQGGSLDMALPGSTGIGLHWHIHVRTMAEENAAAIRQGINQRQIPRCLLPWIPLMTGGGEKSIIQEWKRLALLEPDSRRRSDFGLLARGLSPLTHCEEIWKMELNGWNVDESPIARELVEKGEKRGIQQGILLTKREVLLQLLAAKFPGPFPSEILASVQAQPDPVTLSLWFDVAVKASSLAEVQAAMQMPTTT